ncbi:hypothetical protein [Actinoplanes subtropicus]|uniref:hypothetical protein n=1 Tax=Actinoplanes subtropicus TaxID=543632 RepID=UPI0004C365B2|nr:hypothetical protein [Actinoplanes subtropicus]
MTEPDLPEFTLPELPEVDDAAIRRAVRRGVLRAGLSAAAWLLLAVVLAVVATGTVTALSTRRFAEVVYDGAVAAHPEYEVSGMSCGGGLTSGTVRLDLRARGDIGGSPQTTGQIRRSFLGDVEVDLGDSAGTPVGRALTRGIPAKAATRALLAKVPDVVAASAVVHFTTPQTAAAVIDRYGQDAILFTPPPGSDALVGWPDAGDLARFTRWAGDLRSGDDELLATIGLPPAATLRDVARDPRIAAVIVDRATPAQLRTILDDPLVSGVTLADLNFDPTALPQ